MIASIEVLFFVLGEMGARVEYKNLHARHPQLEGYTRPPVITLDSTLPDRPREHRAILAHEMGHLVYPPLPGHHRYHIASEWEALDYAGRDSIEHVVAKDERLAMKYATDLLIPDKLFWQFAATGPHEYWEWLEEFDVPKWFFEFKVGFIRAGQPARDRLKWRDVVVRG